MTTTPAEADDDLPPAGTPQLRSLLRQPRRKRSSQDTRWSWHPGYLVVLLLIAVSYGLCATQSSPNPSLLVFLVQLVTVALILRVSHVGRFLRRFGWIVLSIAGLGGIIVAITRVEGHGLDIVLSSASMVAYFIAPVAIIAHQVRRDRVDLQTLLAAIAAYILVGMSFTFLYNLIALISTNPTFGSVGDDNLASQLFFSFTTLTTTGYGNLVPVSPAVQSVAVTEAIVGQLFLVIAVARVVTGEPTPRRAADDEDAA